MALGRTGINIPVFTGQGRDQCPYGWRQGKDQCPQAPGRTGINIPTAPCSQAGQGSVSLRARMDKDQCPHGPRRHRDQYSHCHGDLCPHVPGQDREEMGWRSPPCSIPTAAVALLRSLWGPPSVSPGRGRSPGRGTAGRPPEQLEQRKCWNFERGRK